MTEPMTEQEAKADDAYQQLARRRSQPLRERGKRNAWGSWKKRKAGGKQRAGR